MSQEQSHQSIVALIHLSPADPAWRLHGMPHLEASRKRDAHPTARLRALAVPAPSNKGRSCYLREKKSLPNRTVRLSGQWLVRSHNEWAPINWAPYHNSCRATHRQPEALAREAQRVEISAVIGADYVKARY
jgi:hypothetical protein